MDTLASSVSTFKVPTLHSSAASRELHQFNPQSPSTHKLAPQPHLLHSTTKPNSISNQNHHKKSLSLSSAPSYLNSSSISSSSSNLHKKPATGYAAALLDIAQCNSCVHLVANDIGKFLKLLKNKQVEALLENQSVGLKEKGQVVTLVAEKGRCNKHLVGLVKMLVRKNKTEIVKDVLVEFQRIYNELKLHFTSEYEWDWKHANFFFGTSRWMRPEYGDHKVNCDGAWDPRTMKGGYGWIVREFLCWMEAAGGEGGQSYGSAVVIEAVAVREALIACIQNGFRRVEVETDSREVVNLLTQRSTGIVEIEGIIFYIQSLCNDFEFVSFKHICRGCNEAAHKIAAYAVRHGGCTVGLIAPHGYLMF